MIYYCRTAAPFPSSLLPRVLLSTRRPENPVRVHQLSGGEKIPLHDKNVLLRGCQLRNTEWCRGVVVYTGRETKIQMNAAEPPLKSSSLKAHVDRETLHVLCLQVRSLCLASSDTAAGEMSRTSRNTRTSQMWSIIVLMPNHGR